MSNIDCLLVLLGLFCVTLAGYANLPECNIHCAAPASQIDFFNNRETGEKIDFLIVTCSAVSYPKSDCNFDMSAITLASQNTTFNSQRVHALVLKLVCPPKGETDPRTHIAFTNTESRTYDYGIGYIQTNCPLFWEDVAVYGEFVDLRVVTLLDWTDANPIPEANDRILPVGIRNVGTLTVTLPVSEDKISPIRSALEKSLYDFQWDEMAETVIRNADLNLTRLKTSMPKLQGIELYGCNITGVTSFPWQNKTFELPLGIERSVAGNIHYTIVHHGIEVLPWLYRRVFVANGCTGIDGLKLRFKGLIQSVIITASDTRTIHGDAFKDTTGLTVIRIVGTQIKDIATGLFANLSSLKHLELEDSKVLEIPDASFKDLESLRSLSLKGNLISEIKAGAFTKLKSLHTLDVSNNLIISISNSALNFQNSSLRLFNASNNNLKTIPTWTYLIRPLISSYYDNNRIDFAGWIDSFIDINVDTVTYQNRETVSTYEEAPSALHDKVLSLRHNEMTIIPHLNVSKGCSCNSSSDISKRLKTIISFFDVDMTHNELKCNCKAHPLYVYLKSDNVEVGYWIQNKNRFIPCAWPPKNRGQYLLEMDESEFKCELTSQECPDRCTCYEKTVTGDIEINCQGVRLESLPLKLPGRSRELDVSQNDISLIDLAHGYLKDLTYFNASLNNISEIAASAMDIMITTVTIIDLSYNNIHRLPESIKNKQIKAGNTSMFLSNNPYICDCKLEWFKKWLVKHRGSVADEEDMLCGVGSPPGIIGQEILQVDSVSFTCPSWMDDWKSVLALCLVLLIIVCIIIAIPCHLRRGEIKLFLYTQFGWHPFDKHEDDIIGKKYDIFISYSGHDYSWVFSTLKTRLEGNQPPYTLCLHDRDFQIGAPIADNITASVDQSRRMIMVLSKNFLQSDWCMHEFRTAHQRVLKDRTNYLIIILLDDVIDSDLDDDLRQYIKSNTYLPLDNKWFWQKLFYAIPQKPLSILLTNDSYKIESPENDRKNAIIVNMSNGITNSRL